MTARNRAIVWIDYLSAKVFNVGITGVDEVVLPTHLQSEHLHHKANSIGAGHVADGPGFLNDVAGALVHSGEILTIGPGSEKTALLHHLQRDCPKVGAAVVSVENADHSSDGQIVALAKRSFRFATGPRASVGQ
jgi:hypothetical protein